MALSIRSEGRAGNAVVQHAVLTGRAHIVPKRAKKVRREIIAVRGVCRCVCHANYQQAMHRSPRMDDRFVGASACESCADDHDRASYHADAVYRAGLSS